MPKSKHLGLAGLLEEEPLDPNPLEGFADAVGRAPPPPPVEEPVVELDGPPTVRAERLSAPPAPKATSATAPLPFFSLRVPPGLRGAPPPSAPAPGAPASAKPVAGGAEPAMAARLKASRDGLGAVEELLQAQRQDRLRRGTNAVSDALYAATTGARIAPREKGPSLQDDFAARQGLGEHEAAKAKAAQAEARALQDSDPASESSRASQALAAQLLPGFIPQETLARLSKTQLEKMLPVMKEIEAGRATRKASADEADKGRTFQGGEHKLDRELEREKFGATQQAAADKAAGDKANRGQDQVEGWRKEMSQRPEVKQYRDVQVAFDKVKRSAEIAKRTRSPAADMGMIFGIMKMQDPGSTVREGEYANAQNAGSADERLIAMYNRAKDGTLLTPEMREDFLNLAGSFYQSHEDQVRPIVEFYRGQAEKNQLNPDDVSTAIGTKSLGGKRVYQDQATGKWMVED